MGGLNGVLNTDLSGLQAYRAALNTISENVSNATTPGYARRNVELASQYQGTEQVSGTGVDVKGIQRTASNFADTRVRAALSSQGRANSLVNALTTLQANFPSNGGVSQALSQFFSDAKSLSTQPSNQPARQTLISDGQQLAGAFQQVAGNISDSVNNLSQSGTELTQQVNKLLQQLAQINESLRGRSGGSSSNSLLDSQTAALQSLSKLLGVNVVRHSNGTIRLSIRGQVLLDTSGASKLTLQRQSDGTLQLQLPNGHGIGTDALSGQLGGTLTALAQSQTQLQNVNRMAAITASLVNGQQAQGLNNSGAQGSALFSLPTPTVVAQPGNTGSETLSATLKDATKLPANGGPYLLNYDGSQWQATNKATGKSFTVGSGSTLNFKGIHVSISGSPSSGDSFVLDPVNGAAAGMHMTTNDPNAIAAAVPYVGTAGTISGSGAVTNTNAGSAQVAEGSVTSSPGSSLVVPASDFGQSLQVKFTSPTAYQVQTTSGTVISSGSYSASSGGSVAFSYPSGSAAAGKYWQMNISGQPATGDTFTLSPGGDQSGGNADALGQLDTAPVVQGGSLEDAWSYVTGAIGTATQSAQTSQSNANTSVQNAQDAQNAVSGVSLDNQAGELQLYTQAYQASAKAISTVNQLFQSLISVV